MSEIRAGSPTSTVLSLYSRATAIALVVGSGSPRSCSSVMSGCRSTHPIKSACRAMYMCARMHAFVCARVHTFVCICMRACVRMFMQACVHGWLCECLRSSLGRVGVVCCAKKLHLRLEVRRRLLLLRRVTQLRHYAIKPGTHSISCIGRVVTGCGVRQTLRRSELQSWLRI